MAYVPERKSFYLPFVCCWLAFVAAAVLASAVAVTSLLKEVGKHNRLVPDSLMLVD